MQKQRRERVGARSWCPPQHASQRPQIYARMARTVGLCLLLCLPLCRPVLLHRYHPAPRPLHIRSSTRRPPTPEQPRHYRSSGSHHPHWHALHPSSDPDTTCTRASSLASTSNSVPHLPPLHLPAPALPHCPVPSLPSTVYHEQRTQSRPGPKPYRPLLVSVLRQQNHLFAYRQHRQLFAQGSPIALSQVRGPAVTRAVPCACPAPAPALVSAQARGGAPSSLGPDLCPPLVQEGDGTAAGPKRKTYVRVLFFTLARIIRSIWMLCTYLCVNARTPTRARTHPTR